MPMSHPKVTGLGLTYDDVLLIPGASEVSPRDADLTTRLTRGLRLNIPVISAAMDTITEADMAIALAREGGIGILHKNLSIAAQAAMVDRVKRSESGMIAEPLTLSPEHTVKDALDLMRKYRVSVIPIVGDGKKLLGIVTNRDLRFQVEDSMPLKDIMTKDNLVTAPVGTDLEEAQIILHKHKIEKLLIVDNDRVLKGLITFKDIQKKKSFPNASKDGQGRLLVGAAVGAAMDTLERVEALIKAGADAVKVGVGPGSICTTRIVAGVGVPQLTAIMNCAEVCAKNDVPLIADGGIKYTGDIPKAIAAGADTVMLGNMLAGTEESPGKTILYGGRKYKAYRSMGSQAAMAEGSRDRYFQDMEENIGKLVPEGVEGRVSYCGFLRETTHQIIGGLRAAMGYCGTKTIAELKVKGRFVQITQAGVVENHPHDIEITEQSPNYLK